MRRWSTSISDEAMSKMADPNNHGTGRAMQESMPRKKRRFLWILSTVVFLGMNFVSNDLIQMSYRSAPPRTRQNTRRLRFGVRTIRRGCFSGRIALSITNLDLGSNTYQYDGYVWVRYTGDTAKQNIELMNRGANVTMSMVDFRDMKTFKYAAYRVQGTIATTFSLAHFPFDTQILTLEFESPKFEKNTFVFVPDTASFARFDSGYVGLDKNLNVPDYEVINSQIYVTDHSYPTDFGLPETGKGTSEFTRAVFESHVQRKFMPYLTKFLVPIFLMLAVTYLVFFIPPDQLEISIVVVATSLFTAISIGLLQLEISMHVGYLMTTDRFYVLSYMIIVLAFVETIVASEAAEENMNKAYLIHLWSRYLFFPICGLGLFIIAWVDYLSP